MVSQWRRARLTVLVSLSRSDNALALLGREEYPVGQTMGNKIKLLFDVLELV